MSETLREAHDKLLAAQALLDGAAAHRLEVERLLALSDRAYQDAQRLIGLANVNTHEGTEDGSG